MLERLAIDILGRGVAEKAFEPLAVPAFGPAGTSMLATASDMLRFAALHLDYPALAVLRRPQSAARIHGWLDDWCLGWALFDWQGGRVWGWDSVLNAERAVLRLVPGHRAAVVLMTNGSTGRALYRALPRSDADVVRERGAAVARNALDTNARLHVADRPRERIGKRLHALLEGKALRDVLRLAGTCASRFRAGFARCVSGP